METVRLRLNVLGETVELNASVPVGQARLDEVLPLLRQIDDVAIDRSVAQSEAAGKPISCCRGCSACCRAQPVPVTPSEAYALWRLVESLPEPRRSEIRAKFADREQRLDESGLADVFLNSDRDLTGAEAREIARRYFRLGLVCPFLENDACGIYHERPFVCRQYLVTSPSSLCSDPFANKVDVVPMPLAAATGFQRVSSEMLGRQQYTIPLSLALTYVERHRDELERTFDSRELTEKCVRAVLE
jgi:Fe-S-cluster containining protein